VVDLAVAVVMGAAFTAIVNALANDMIMPFIGVLLGGIDFSSLALTIGEATIAYGKFIQAVINFLIIALVLFLIVRTINQVQRQFTKEQDKNAILPPKPSTEEKLLTEIRDLLKENQQK
jgi:large conductance mechanosensitive channel